MLAPVLKRHRYLPVLESTAMNWPSRVPANVTPPAELKLTRVNTASVGFAGLMVQAITDATFEAAMVESLRTGKALGLIATKKELSADVVEALKAELEAFRARQSAGAGAAK